MRTFKSITLDEALELQAYLLRLAKSDELGEDLDPVAICIVDACGRELTSLIMTEVKQPSLGIARNKARTAIEFERDTITFRHQEVRPDDFVRDQPGEGWTDEDLDNAGRGNPWFISWGGGAVIVDPKTREVVGAVGVSNRSEIDDHRLAASRPQDWLAT